MQTHTYRDLIVWQKAMELVIKIYTVTHQFPKEKLYGLTSQIRRAAVSIPANIAEGKLRGLKKACRQFFLVAFGSGRELETHIEIAKRLEKTCKLDYTEIDALLSEVMRMLNTMITSLKPSA
jgi:four helix bundle protein